MLNLENVTEKNCSMNEVADFVELSDKTELKKKKNSKDYMVGEWLLPEHAKP